jgi:hypothetical protein
MCRFRAVPLLLVLATAPAVAQPAAGKVNPDRIDVGTVYTGATVEASFQVFEPGTDPKIKFEVTAPKFVKVLSKDTRYEQFGKGNDFVCGSVEIAIDTAAAADLSGEVAVTLGDSKVKVPISATVKARKKGYSRVLVVETPFDKYSTSDGSVFKPWTDLVAKSPLDVSYLLVLKDKPVFRDLDLSKFDCVFVAENGLIHLKEADVKAVRKYAEGGGRVVVAANSFFVGTVPKANEVLADYGIEVQNTEAAGVGKDETIGKDQLHPRLVKDGIESVTFYRASPIRVTDAKRGRVLIPASGVGEPGDAFVASVAAGKGEVIAIGQSLWWNWISEQRAKGADNAKLLRWLLVPRGGA